MEEKMNEAIAVNEKQIKKQNLENLCRKIMGIVIPCLCIMMILLTVFKGSKEARGVKSALKAEGCDVKICTGSEASEILEELGLEISNVDELVVASDKQDSEIYAFVLFCESRLDAEDAEKILKLYLFYSDDSYSYSVERNAKAVCFGYVDLVEVVMEELD